MCADLLEHKRVCFPWRGIFLALILVEVFLPQFSNVGCTGVQHRLCVCLCPCAWLHAAASLSF